MLAGSEAGACVLAGSGVCGSLMCGLLLLGAQAQQDRREREARRQRLVVALSGAQQPVNRAQTMRYVNLQTPQQGPANEEVVLFMHIHKSGGTTVRAGGAHPDVEVAAERGGGGASTGVGGGYGEESLHGI